MSRHRLVFGFFLLLGIAAVSAQNLVITEVNSHTTAGASYMEIYNMGSSSQDLTEWKIRYYNNGSTSVTATVNLQGSLNTDEYLIVARDSAAFKTVYGFYPEYDQGGFYFNGPDDGVELYNGTAVVDRFNNTGGLMTSWTDDHRFERKNYPNTGADLTNDWEDKGTGAGSPKAPNDLSLSVSMSEFYAVNSNQGVRLNWSTESEVGSLGFIVLHSADRDGPYERIGRIQGNGNTSSKSTYEFVDTHADPGSVNWYLLEEWCAEGKGDVWGPLAVCSKLQDNIIPESYKLIGCFPNPFNPVTTIRFEVPGGKPSIRLSIFNIAGQPVVTLLDRPMTPGVHEIQWDGRNESGKESPNGAYLAVLAESERPLSAIRLVKSK